MIQRDSTLVEICSRSRPRAREHQTARNGELCPQVGLHRLSGGELLESEPWPQIPALPRLAIYCGLGLHHDGPQFPHLKNGAASPYFTLQGY